VLRADGVLELYATEGLNREAVHLAQLKMGQGLVGTIAASAQPLNLSDAQSHPAFRYLPETGEEIYHSFLGVPILRAPAARSAFSSCRTRRAATIARKSSKRSRRRRWCSPR
jgi:signal transduction protein with GAF and PtsI domain